MKQNETQKEKKKDYLKKKKECQWVMGQLGMEYNGISKGKNGNQKYPWRSNGQKFQSLTNTINL